MPNITISVPSTTDLNRAVDAFCARFGYQTNVPDGSGGTMVNPETRNNFAKRQVAIWIKSIAAEYEGEQAAIVARTAAGSLDIT